MKKLGPAAWAMLAPMHLLLAAVITLPSLYVFWLSLHESSYGTGLDWVGWSNYAQVFGDPAFWRAFWNTFWLVNGVVYAEMLLGLALALLFASGLRFKRLMFAIILMPYAVSEVVGALAWKIMMNASYGPIGRLLQDAGIPFAWSSSPTQGLILAGLVSVWHHLPFTFLLLYAGLLSIPQSLYEAARIDGANAWQCFLRITLPLLVPALLITVIFRLVFSFRIFTEVWLITRGGPARLSEVLAVYLYQGAFRNGDFGPAAATGWIMVAGSLLLASVYLFFMHKRMASHHA